MDRKQLNFKMKLMLINKDEYNLYAEDGGRTDERLCLEKVSENECMSFILSVETEQRIFRSIQRMTHVISLLMNSLTKSLWVFWQLNRQYILNIMSR